MEHFEIIQALANDVYKQLGRGHQECVYHRAMLIALEQVGFNCETEVTFPIHYNNKYCGQLRCDIIIDKEIILELKSTNKREFIDSDQEVAQLEKYLEITGYPNGVLINFTRNNGVIFYKIKQSETL